MPSEAKHLNLKGRINSSRARITRGRGPEAYNDLMDHSKLAVVDRFASQAEADLAKSALESAGIDAMIQSDRAGGMRDHLAWSGLGFKVLVREEDASEAHDVLQPPPEELVSVQTFGTQAEADTASDILLSAGIVATIQDSVGIPVSPTFRVLANKKDADKARYVLKQLSEAPTQGNG